MDISSNNNGRDDVNKDDGNRNNDNGNNDNIFNMNNELDVTLSDLFHRMNGNI
jgi:hypothetical protein